MYQTKTATHSAMKIIKSEVRVDMLNLPQYSKKLIAKKRIATSDILKIAPFRSWFW